MIGIGSVLDFRIHQVLDYVAFISWASLFWKSEIKNETNSKYFFALGVSIQKFSDFRLKMLKGVPTEPSMMAHTCYPALPRLKQEDCWEFKDNLGCIVRLSPKQKQTIKTSKKQNIKSCNYNLSFSKPPGSSTILSYYIGLSKYK